MRFALVLLLSCTLLRSAGSLLPDIGPLLPDIGYPLRDIQARELKSQFLNPRKGHVHYAIDLMRRRGTPVLAASDGVVRKLYRSRTGGISAYLFDGTEEYCFFYGHLDHYAKGLREGQKVHRGQVIGYVGSTGNAKRSAPHLHFAVSLTGPQRKWSGGQPIDPYPLLLAVSHASGAETVAAVDAETDDHIRSVR